MSVIGLRAGPYEIVAPAAVPGSRQWFVARRKAAIRTVPPRALLRVAGVRALEELRSQYNVLRTIQDPRIPTAIGLYEDVGALATTLVSGKPLSEAIDGRHRDELHMTPATLLDVLMELSEALARAHGRQCHHGRLDPSQVWMTDMGSLWILGFGESRDGAMALQWLAPEQARGTSVGVWTDQWSLAAFGTALITGQPLWGPHNPGEQARVGDVAPSLTVVAQQWPALARVFHKMLDPEPARRFSSLAAVRQELAYLARQAGNNSDRRALGAWLATAGRRTPPPLRGQLQGQETTVVVEASQVLPSGFGESPTLDQMISDFDEEVTGMTEVFRDGHVQLAEARLTEPGEAPALVDPPMAEVQFVEDPLGPPVHQDEGATEQEAVGPRSTPSPPPSFPPEGPGDEHFALAPPEAPSGAVALWIFVIATLLALLVGGLWLVAQLVLLPEI